MCRVGIGLVGYVPSWLCAEFAMCRVGKGRVGYVPSLLCAELTRHPANHTRIIKPSPLERPKGFK